MLVNVRVREKVDFERLSTVKEAVAEVRNAFRTTAGLLLRYSGTEPLARSDDRERQPARDREVCRGDRRSDQVGDRRVGF